MRPTRAGAALPAGHRLGLLQLFLIRSHQPLDHLRQVIDVGGQPVDARQHLVALGRPQEQHG